MNTGSQSKHIPVCRWCRGLHATYLCEQLALLCQTTQLIESLSWLECNPSNPLVSVSVAQEDQILEDFLGNPEPWRLGTSRKAIYKEGALPLATGRGTPDLMCSWDGIPGGQPHLQQAGQGVTFPGKGSSLLPFSEEAWRPLNKLNQYIWNIKRYAPGIPGQRKNTGCDLVSECIFPSLCVKLHFNFHFGQFQHFIIEISMVWNYPRKSLKILFWGELSFFRL